MWRWIGGPMGRHAAPGGAWRNPTPWALLLATLTWILTMWRNAPCIQTSPDSYPETFTLMCYTDIPVLYLNRGLATGSIPLVDIPMEYPVLTTWVMEMARRAVNLFGGNSGPDATALQQVQGAEVFYAVTAVVMFLSFLALVIVHLRLHRPWDALLIAASPLVVAGGLINWDMLVVFLASATILAWSRQRTLLAGLLLGLAIAAKLYPVFWLVPLFVLCLRTGTMRRFITFAWGTVASWVGVNAPMYVISPQNWLNFWTFNVDRGPDLGSIWYVMALADFNVSDVSRIVSVLLALAGLLLAALIVLAPRRPRLAPTLFVITAAFLILNKVYSPQYMLWLLPLLILSRPKAREWIIFTIAELGYWAAVWGHLAQVIGPGDGGPDKLYWLAVIVRVCVQVWLVGLMVRDMIHPEHDPLRSAPFLDDPDGGIFDHAPDSPAMRTVRERLGFTSWGHPVSTATSPGPDRPGPPAAAVDPRAPAAVPDTPPVGDTEPPEAER